MGCCTSTLLSLAEKWYYFENFVKIPLLVGLNACHVSALAQQCNQECNFLMKSQYLMLYYSDTFELGNVDLSHKEPRTRHREDVLTPIPSQYC
jgi:hypothetical protein